MSDSQSNGFVWMPYDESCQVIADVFADRVTLTSVMGRGKHAGVVTLRLSHDDFVGLAHMMGRLANDLTEDWRWSSEG